MSDLDRFWLWMAAGLLFSELTGGDGIFLGVVIAGALLLGVFKLWDWIVDGWNWVNSTLYRLAHGEAEKKRYNELAEAYHAANITKSSYDAAAQVQICADLYAHYGSEIVTTKQVKDYTDSRGMPMPWFLTTDKKHKAGWGKHRVLFAGSTAEIAAKDLAAKEQALVEALARHKADRCASGLNGHRP